MQSTARPSAVLLTYRLNSPRPNNLPKDTTRSCLLQCSQAQVTLEYLQVGKWLEPISLLSRPNSGKGEMAQEFMVASKHI